VSSTDLLGTLRATSTGNDVGGHYRPPPSWGAGEAVPASGDRRARTEPALLLGDAECLGTVVRSDGQARIDDPLAAHGPADGLASSAAGESFTRNPPHARIQSLTQVAGTVEGSEDQGATDGERPD